MARTNEIPTYVLDLARADALVFSETLKGAKPATINEALWAQAYTNVDLGSLESFDRDAYVVAIKAIVCGLAA